MWAFLLKFLPIIGSSIGSIVKQIQEEKTKQLNSKNEAERIASDERIKVLEAKRDILLESYRNRWDNIVRFLWAAPFILYIWKLIIWDKILEWGITDPLSPTLENIMWTVLGGYFLVYVVDKIKK